MNRAHRRQAARRIRRAGLPAAVVLASGGLATGGFAPAVAQDPPAEPPPAASTPAPEPAPAPALPAPAPTPAPAPPPAAEDEPLGSTAPNGATGPREQQTTGERVRKARDNQGARRTRDRASRPGGAAAQPETSVAEPGPAPVGVPNFFIEKFRIPPFLLPIYQAAGTEYGIRWEILAAINEIETDYGRNLNRSSAGAQGWMQFMPPTWKAYGVDANRDGRKDPYNPVDAIFAAARYLKAAGAKDDLRKAIFAYNHADWYVESVLMRAKLIGGLPSDLIGSLSGLTQGLFPVHAKARYTDAVDPKRATRRGHAGENPATPVEGEEDRRQIRIYAKAGSPATAVQDGTIVGMGRTERLGRYVRLRDAFGNEYTYAHLKSVSDTVAVAKQGAVQTAKGIADELSLPGGDPEPTRPASTTRRGGDGTASRRGRDGNAQGASITAVGREHDDLRPMGGALTALDTLILRTARTVGTQGAATVALPGDTGVSRPPETEDPQTPPAQTTPEPIVEPEAEPVIEDQPAVAPTTAPAIETEPEAPSADPAPALAPAPVAPAPPSTTPEPTATVPIEAAEPLPLPQPAVPLPDTPEPTPEPSSEQPIDGLPDGATFGRYFTVDYGLARDEVQVRRLKVGQRVIAGTVLGRIGTPDAAPRDERNADPHLLFEIRPAGRGAPRIDPKPILDGWKLLESTALYRAKGRNALTGATTSVGQILLMDKQALQRRVLNNPRIDLYACGRRDIAAGIVDRRVLATLEFLAASGLKPTVTSLRCGHGVYTSSGNVSHHTTGTAMDIAAINGITITPATQGPGSITDITVRRLLTLQGTMKPAQIITLRQYDGADNTVAMADHDDHIHVGWRPGNETPRGRLSNELSSALRPSQWTALVKRLSKIENPEVGTAP